MSLPTVPPGTNPFTVYKAALHSMLYPNPSSGFKIRLGVLFGMAGLLIILSIAHWVVLFRDWRKNRRGSPLWLFRLADRLSGRYIVTNGKLVLSLFSLITAAVFIGQIYDIYHAFIQQGSQSQSAAIRTWATLPLFMQGWLMPWASLQASILASEADNKPLLSARVANVLFAGVGGLFFLGLVASNIVNTIAGSNVWHQFEKIYSAMGRYEEAWTPTSDAITPLLALNGELQELTRRVEYNRTVQLGTLGVWLLIPICVITVNVASLRLSRLMHRQVQFNIEQFIGPFGQDTQVSHHSNSSGQKSHGRPSISAQSADLIKKLRDGRLSVSHLTRSDLMRLANRRGSGPERERVRHIQALQKAEKDLVVTSYVILTAILAIFAICIYYLYVIAARKSTSTWGNIETSLTATAWIYLTALNLVLISLLWFNWNARSIQLGDSMTTSWVSGPNRPTMTSTGSMVHAAAASRTGSADPAVVIDFDSGAVSSTSSAHLQLPKFAPTGGELDCFAWPTKSVDGSSKEHSRTEVLRFADEDEEEAQARAFARRESEAPSYVGR
ncbi:hypothetical protein JCM10450v2_008010 [Rhodotorula kratochvilovae]